MKLKINDPDYGDMELEIDHETADLVYKDSIVVFRKKDVKFTLAQEEGKEPHLYTVMFLEQGEYERNYDQLDWECNWPCEVAFVPADNRRFRARYGDNVSASSHWDKDDFFKDEDEAIENIVRSLSDEIYITLRDSDMTDSVDYGWVMKGCISKDGLRNMLDFNKGKCVYFNADKYWGYKVLDAGAEQNDPLLTFVCDVSDLIMLAAENLDKDAEWYTGDDSMHHTFVPFDSGDSHVCNMDVVNYAEAVASAFLYSHQDLLKKLLNTPLEGSPQRELPSWAWGYLDVTEHSGCVWRWAGTGYFDRWDSSSNAGVLYYCPQDIKDAMESGVNEDDIKKYVKQSLDLALHMMDDCDSPYICNVISYNVLGNPIENCDKITECYGWQYDKDMEDNIESMLRGGKLEKVDFTIVHAARL